MAYSYADTAKNVGSGSGHITSLYSDVVVSGSGSVPDEILPVSSARDLETDRHFGMITNLRDPVALLRELKGDGGDANVALQVVLEYYKAASDARVSVVDETPATPVTQRFLRRQLWQQRVAALAAGQGYCYLHAIRYARRERLAGLLGPEPTVRKLVESLCVEDIDAACAKKFSVFRIASSMGISVYRYHVAEQCEVGEYVSSLYTFLSSYLRHYSSIVSTTLVLTSEQIVPLPLVGTIGVDAVVDASCVKGSVAMNRVQCVRGPLPQSVLEAARVFRHVMMYPREVNDTLVLMLPDQSEALGVQSPGASFAGSVNFQHRSIYRDCGEYSLQLNAVAMSALVLPVGVALSYGGVLYGALNTRVIVILSKFVQLDLVAARGASVTYQFLSPSEFSIRDVVTKCGYDAKSSDARFVRAVASPVVLRCPRGLLPSEQGQVPSVIALTDPLEDFVAITKVRYEANSACYGDVVCLPTDTFTQFTKFRTCTSGYSALLEGCILLNDVDAAVTLLRSKPKFQLVLKPYDDGLERPPPLGLKWSIRARTSHDDYSMDGGGPSDSDFSDCF